MKKLAILAVTHLVAVAAGFALGVYLLPILIAPASPSRAEAERSVGSVEYTGEFRRDLAGSDLLHWGEGRVLLGRSAVALVGRIAPGPAYKLYLAPEFVENEEQFIRVRQRSLALGDVRTFENFVVAIPDAVDLARYDTVVVWCEAFSEFITAARYR